MNQQPLLLLFPGDAEGHPVGSYDSGKFARFERGDTWGLCTECRRRTRGLRVWTVDGVTTRHPACAKCWLNYRWSGLQVMRGGAA